MSPFPKDDGSGGVVEGVVAAPVKEKTETEGETLVLDDCAVSELQRRVSFIVSQKYRVGLNIYKKKNKKTGAAPTAALCHESNNLADFYSVVASFPRFHPTVKVYDFCGPKYRSKLSRTERNLAFYLSRHSPVYMVSAPCAASRSGDTKKKPTYSRC